MTVFRASVICVLLAARTVLGQVEDWPDYRTVAADLQVPQMMKAEPAAGQRVRRNLPQYDSNVYYALYLPSDWQPGKSYPVIVEYAGNGGYQDPLGDECSGRPEDCNLGYGMSAGVGFIWICLPYLNNNGNDLTITWWGDAPAYDPQPTLKFCRAAVADVCANFGGDSGRVMLSGFSRGAIACNYLGLFDDETSRLWRAFVPCSHYDGVRRWPYPDSDAAAAAMRLKRLQERPQFICGERDQIEETRKYLASFELQHITFASTGFRNHSDQWILRPSPTRDRLREWLTEVIRAPKSTAKPPTAKPSTASPSTASPSTPKPPTPNPQ